MWRHVERGKKMAKKKQSTYRVIKDKDFSMMHNGFLIHDDRLTYKAKGILATILSFPDDWQIFERDLAERSKDGIDSLQSGISELMQYHYIFRKRTRKENGHWDVYQYWVFEVPNPGFNPDSDEECTSYTGKSNIGSSSVGKSNILYSINLKEYDTDSAFELIWSLYPKKVQKGRALKAFKKALKENKKNQDIAQEIFDGVKNYAEYCKARGVDAQYIQHGATYFNNDGWEDVYEIPSQKESKRKSTMPKVDEKTLDDMSDF
jgi:hypothetical protein